MLKFEHQIIRLKNQYIKLKRRHNENYIKKLVVHIAKEKKVYKYIKKIEFFKFKSTANKMLYYDMSTKTMFINPELFEQNYDMSIFKKFDIDKEDKNEITNILMLKAIFEEIEKLNIIYNHRNQLDRDLLLAKNYIFDEKTYYDMIESDYSVDNALISSLLFLDDTNSELPINRTSEIQAWKMCLNLVNRDHKQNKYLLKYINSELLKSQLTGYTLTENQIVESPMIKFMKKAGQHNSINHISWYSSDQNECLKKASKNYSMTDRLDYGLPISNEEYDKIKIKVNY